jgi:hypothetical protein
MEGFWLPSVCTKSTVGSAVTDLPVGLNLDVVHLTVVPLTSRVVQTLLNVVTCRQQTQLDDLHYQL